MSEKVEKAKKTLDIVVKAVAILALISMAFAVWFSINFAKSKTKQELDKRQTYFNDVHSNFQKDWAKNAYWDSIGVEQSVYVNEKNAQEISIQIQKQKFNDEYNVKSNILERPDIYEVLKLNMKENIGDSMINSDMFYLCMNPLVLHKMTANIWNKNGITYKSYFNNKSVISMQYDSFKDKEGKGEKVFEKDIMPFEQLYFSLRSLDLDSVKDFKLKVLEPQLKSGIGSFKITKVDVRTKRMDNVYDVIVEFNDKSYCSFKFENSYPNKLISFNKFGEVYQLKK